MNINASDTLEKINRDNLNREFCHNGYLYRFMGYVKQDSGNVIVCELLEGWMSGTIFALNANEVCA